MNKQQFPYNSVLLVKDCKENRENKELLIKTNLEIGDLVLATGDLGDLINVQVDSKDLTRAIFLKKRFQIIGEL